MNELIATQTDDALWSGIMDGFALLDLARGWLKQGNPVVAAELLRSAVNSPEAESDRQLRAQILKESGRARMMQSDWGSSEFYYLEAQRVFLDVNDLKGASECARNRANMLFQQGKYRQAEDLCDQALKWASEIEDHELRATILNTLAAIKSATGNHREAIKTFGLCLADFRCAGNTIRQGYVMLNIGLAHTELGEYNGAVLSLKQALSIALSEKDQHLVEICYQNISKCYLAQKETNLAKSVIETARKILPGLDSKALETELNLIDSRILRVMGDLDSAEAMLRETHGMATDNGLSALEADVLYEQGQLLKDRGYTEAAITKLDAAANLYKQLGIDRGFQDAIAVLNQLRRKADV